MKIGCDILLTFGINGSLRKREVQAQPQPQASYTEYYLFNSAANLKAYSNNGLDFAYYGYNASNTRTYKLNFLNANSWVNGQQLPIHPQSIQAMFYPNAYMNFNHNGEYTKHYYNGSERIASRLGNTALSISMEMTDRLQERVGKLETRFQDDIRELVYTNVQVETPPVSVSSLQSTGTATDIFYYHMNHLGSTAFVTDQNQNITQGFLYAPFGEITTEFNAAFGNDIIPKYSFNAKELDEETGMYYYEARYYKPPVFTSRDPMFEKYFWMTPYAYCANNPVKYVDPSGEEIGKFYSDWGEYLGTDGKDDGEVYIVSKWSDKKTIRRNNRANGTTQVSEVSSAIRLPLYETRQEMCKQMEEGDKTNPFAEHGGFYGIDLNSNIECTRPAKEGPTCDPSDPDGHASIDYNTANQSSFLKKGTYHGHSSGKKNGAYFIQRPSQVDLENAKTNAEIHNMCGINIVFGMDNKMVYLYDQNGKVIKISFSTFKKIK